MTRNKGLNTGDFTHMVWNIIIRLLNPMLKQAIKADVLAKRFVMMTLWSRSNLTISLESNQSNYLFLLLVSCVRLLRHTEQEV